MTKAKPFTISTNGALDPHTEDDSLVWVLCKILRVEESEMVVAPLDTETPGPSAGHPLHDEDLRVEIILASDVPDLVVTITHLPTGVVGSAAGSDEETCREMAMDDLLGHLEQVSG